MKQDLRAVLTNLKKEELINFLIDLASNDEYIEKQLLFQFGHDENELTSSKKLIKEYIQKAKSRGFIEWNRVNYALQGADLVLQKVEGKIEQGQTEIALSLSLAVLGSVVDMLQFSDDSNGSVGDVIRYSMKLVHKALATQIWELPEKEQNKLFETVVKEALNKRYNGWDEWRIELLGTCVPFSHNQKLRVKLESTIESLLSQLNDSWSSKYEQSALKSVQLEIIERCEGSQQAEKFIYENIQLSDFREKAILLELKKGNADKVVSLCLEGEKKDQSFPGLLKQWREYRYQAYEQLEDISNQRELARMLLLGNDFSFYTKLKELYPPHEWTEVLNGIVEDFRKMPYQTDTYLSILIAENLTKLILDYCKNEHSYITRLYPYLMEDYLDEVNGIFRAYILEEAEAATERKKYKQVCKLIKTYRKACGSDQSNTMIEELMERNKRRPAFLDELEKI